MQTDLSTFGNPPHVQTIERIQERAKNALESNLKQVSLDDC